MESNNLPVAAHGYSEKKAVGYMLGIIHKTTDLAMRKRLSLTVRLGQPSILLV